MHIAPKPGLLYPAFALEKLHHRKGLLFCVILLLLGTWAFSADSVVLHPEEYNKSTALLNISLRPPGVPDLSHPDTKLTIILDNSFAGPLPKGGLNKIKAHIVDEFGNPVQGQSVTFTWNPGTGDVSIGVTTDANGDAYLETGFLTAGTLAITAKVDGVPLLNNNPIVVTFIDYIPDVSAPNTQLTVATNHAKADGTATNCVKAHVAGSNGLPVAGQTVSFHISGTATPAGPLTASTNAAGDATICLKSLVAGDVSVTAEVNGVPIVNGSAAVVTFVADVPNVTVSTTFIKTLDDNALANGIATNRVQAHITDANGNPVADQEIVFAIPSGIASPAASYTVKTDANGDAFFLLVSIKANTVTVTATVNGAAITNGSPQHATFVADAPSAGAPTTKLETTHDGAIADGVATNCVKAYITDANGNPVTGQEVVFAKPSGTATPAGSYTATTDVNGEASLCFTSTVSGQISVTATFNGTAINGSPKTLTFKAAAPNPSVPTTFIKTLDDNALANGVATNRVQAHITDANGNPVADQEVVFAIPSGIASPATSYTVKTDANGDAFFLLVSTKANTVTVTATVNGAAITNGSPQPATFVTDAPSAGAPTTKLETTHDGAIADGVATNCVKAYITDANGNPVSGQEVVFAKPSGTATPAGSYTATTDVNGEASLCFTSTVSGQISVTASINGAAINGSPKTLTFKAAASNPSVSTTFIKTLDDNALANGVATNRVQAHITDINGNPVIDQEVVFAIPSGTASPATSYTVKTDANGDAFFLLVSTKANTVTVTATVNGAAITNGSPQPATFVTDAPSTGAPDTYLKEIKTVANADGVDMNKVLAHITDANGNPVANQEVIFTLTGSITTIQTVKTDADGNALLTMQSTAAGWVTITATVGGAAITNGSPGKVKFIEGAPDTGNDQTRLEVVTNNAPADDVSTNSVKAHIADAFGNPVPNQTVTFTIASGTASPGTYTATTDADGNALFEFHSDRGGEVTVTAKLNTDNINNSPATVKFIADADVSNPATILIVLTDNALANGIATNSVKAHITDAYGNALENKEVVFAITSGDAVITGSGPFMTDANGDIILLLTSKKAGFVTIAAKINGNMINGSPAKLRFTIEDVWVPKVFTPNGDGTNDILKPIITGAFDFSYFSIYNRWGNLVFSTTNVNNGWDGRLKSVMQPIETYLWIIGGKDGEGNPVQRKGMVSLVR